MAAGLYAQNEVDAIVNATREFPSHSFYAARDISPALISLSRGLLARNGREYFHFGVIGSLPFPHSLLNILPRGNQRQRKGNQRGAGGGERELPHPRNSAPLLIPRSLSRRVSTGDGRETYFALIARRILIPPTIVGGVNAAFSPPPPYLFSRFSLLV